jgi:methyl-accepting chemotaxis protein
MLLASALSLAGKVADGDLSTVIRASGKDEVELLLNSLQLMQNSLSTLVTKVRRGSQAVASASSEIAQGNQDLSSRTEQQARSLAQTSASMEQLGATVKQNAESALQANQLAQNATSIAEDGGRVVVQLVETMRNIQASSRQIGDIIGVIDGIACQTNILALNAAVEAARAGEQGRGFAVMASEVRSLAGRSAEAAREFKRLISASVARVEQGSGLADRSGATMTEVVGSIKRVTDIMGEISAASAASGEQASGVAPGRRGGHPPGPGHTAKRRDGRANGRRRQSEEPGPGAGAIGGSLQAGRNRGGLAGLSHCGAAGRWWRFSRAVVSSCNTG